MTVRLTHTQALYDPVVARYSSPATAALGRLLLPYLFPELLAFATIEDMVSHLRTSDARYCATVPAEFLDKNQPLMFITLYFIVTRLPDSLRSVRDHFLSVDPTSLTFDLLEQHLLAAETSAVAVGAARGTPRPPFFEGCSPSPLAPSYASAAAAADVSVAEDAGAACASAKRRNSKRKGGRGGGGGSGGGGGGSGSVGGGSSGGGGGSGGGGVGGTSGGSGGSSGDGGGSGGSGGSGGGGTGGGRTGPRRGGPSGGQRQQQQRRSETQSSKQLREWMFQRGTSGVSDSCPYVIRTGVRAGQACGKLHTQHRCFSRLDNAWRAEFGDDVKPPPWADLLSAEGECYRCVPPDPSIAAAALGASEFGASRCFFRDSPTLTPLPAPVLVRLADPTPGGQRVSICTCTRTRRHLATFTRRSGSRLLLVSPPGGQRVSICTCTRTRRHLATFTRRPGSSLYTLATESPQVAVSAQVSASGQVAASCLCRLLSQRTLLWHHRLGHPSLPRLRGMHSRLLVSGLPRSLPPLPPSPAPPCLPCIEGRQRAAPHSSFPSTTAPLQTLHMDVWGPARVSGQGRERYFLLVVDDYTRYTSVFPLGSKGEVVDRRIGLVMEVARTSMIHAAAPHFLWPFAVQCAAHQLNLWPRVSLPETSPTLRWTGELSDASLFRFYHPTSRRVLPSEDVTLTNPLPGTALVEVAVGSGAARGATSGGAASGGAEPRGVESECAGSGVAEPGGEEPECAELEGVEPRGVEPGGVEPEGVEPRGAESEGAESGGAKPWGAASSAVELPELEVLELLLRLLVLELPGLVVLGSLELETLRSLELLELEALALVVQALELEELELQELELLTHELETQPPLLSASPLPAPSPYIEQFGGLTKRHEPASRPVSPVRTARHVPRSRPPPVPGMHAMALRRSSVPLRVPLPSPPESSFPALLDLDSDRAHLLATVVTDLSFESVAASALVADLHDFAAACSQDYATALVAESASASPPSVRGECALCTDVLEDSQEDFEYLAAALPHFASMLLAPEGDPDAPDIPTPRSYTEAITGPYSSQWQAAMDAKMASWKSTGTYVDKVLPSGANIVDGMWIFRVKRPLGSSPAFKARYVARGFSQRKGADYFHTFSPTPKMTTLRVLLHVAAQRDYQLHSLDFTTAFLQGSLHEEIWLRRPPGFTWSFPAGTQLSLWRPVYSLRKAPHEWHDTLRTTLAALGFAPSTADPSLCLRTDALLPLFYVLVYVDDLVFATADTEALTLVKSELQKRHTCTDLGVLRSYLGLQITRDRARRTIPLTQSHMVHQVLQRFGFQFSSPQPTPLSTSHWLSDPPSDEFVEPSGPYPELVGCLMYMMTCTQPDLAFPLSLLAHYVAPGRHRKVHWDAAKRVLRYLCSTSGMGLVL
ncbi:unnamed protein product [Closterium sp. NIES-53]